MKQLKMSKNNVLYLISRENLLEPGVLKSQVLDLLGEIKKQSIGSDITILNLPSINRFLKYFKNYYQVRDYCKKLGIRFFIIPIVPVARSFMPIWAVPFYLIQVIPLILFFVLRYRINIIHARSYLSALAGWFVRKIGVQVRFVFDMRAPYLLEGVIHGKWQKTESDYKFWEGLEKKMFESADFVVAQATGMVGYVKKAAPESAAVYIPNCVSDQLYKVTPAERKKGREEQVIADRFVFVYSGSFGRLHPPDFIAKLYADLRKFVQDPYLLVVTYSDPQEISKALFKLDVPQREFKILQNPPKLEKILSLGDAGIAAMGGEISTTSLVLSVKVVEYLAAGLPVITSNEMKSVVEILKQNNCGVMVDPFDKRDIRVKMQKLVEENSLLKINSIRVARKYFSTKVCARQYLNLYEKLA